MKQIVNVIGGGLAARESALTLANYGVEVHLFDELKFTSLPVENDKANKYLFKELTALDCQSICSHDNNLANFEQNSIKKLIKSEKIKVFDKKISEIALPEPCIIATGEQTTEPLLAQMEEVFGKLDRSSEAKQIVLLGKLDCQADGEQLFLPLMEEDIKRAYDYVKDFDFLSGTIEGEAKGGYEFFKAKIFKKSIICGKIYDSALKFKVENGKNVLLTFKTNLDREKQSKLLEILHIKNDFENVTSKKCAHLNAFRQFYPSLQSKKYENIFFAGSILGIEGALAAVATGHLAGLNMLSYLSSQHLNIYPSESACGKLIDKLFLQNGYKNDENIKMCDIIGEIDKQKAIKTLEKFKEDFDARFSWHNDMCSKKRW